MKIEITKTNGLYEEFITYMAYRYAIGLAGASNEYAQKRLSAYEIFREMEYDTPEFHQLADDIAQYLKRKKIKDIVDLQKRCKEAELNWFSYHYALGRHSYAASLCHDIAQYGRMVLSPERQEFTAYDIRREIGFHLSMHSINFHYPIDFEQEHSPLDYLLRFLKENNITTNEQLAEYSHITVVRNADGLSFETRKKDDGEGSYCHALSDLSDYLEWDDLASFFDPKMHKQCIIRYEGKEQTVNYFDSWIPIYDGSGGYKFEKVKRPIDRYAAAPYRCCYINEEYIVEDKVSREGQD